MATTRLPRAIALLIGFTVSFALSAAPDVGSKITAELKIESDRGIKRIPIPEGEWLVLHVHKNSGMPKFGGSKANDFIQVIAAQSINSVMTKMLDVRVNSTSEVPRYTDELCKPYVNGRFHEDRYVSEVWDQACLQVSHLSEFLAVSGSDKPPWTHVRSELRLRGWSYPSSLVGMWYRRYDQRGQWLSYRIALNPTTFGFSDFDGKWADSPWHKDFVGRDPKRLAVMNALLQQSKDVQRILDEHFKDPTEKSPRNGFFFKAN